jgi:hypothetical protein
MRQRRPPGLRSELINPHIDVRGIGGGRDSPMRFCTIERRSSSFSAQVRPRTVAPRLNTIAT